jgi:hypothetical protein
MNRTGGFEPSNTGLIPVVLTNNIMAYERYKEIKSKEQFFDEWDQESLKCISRDTQDTIYKKYVLKCAMFQRDQFKCQNTGCANPDSPLTMHHIKWQKNNGQDKLKNCVTICRTCHKAFHRGKKELVFWGMTFKVHKEVLVDWKKLKKDNKIVRKNHKDVCGVRISYELLQLLIEWLDHPYQYLDGEDD